MAQVCICEHIKDNGDTCGSPALTGYSFCYFHQRLRQPRHRPGDFEYKLPILDTPHAILMGTQHITQAALDGILEERRARLVVSALRLAMTALKEMNKTGRKENSLNDKLSDAARPRAASASAEENVGNGNENNVSTGALTRAARAQFAVSAEPTKKPLPSATGSRGLSSRAPQWGEGSALAPLTGEADPAAPATGNACSSACATRQADPAAAAAPEGFAHVTDTVSPATAADPAAAAAPEGSPRREPWVSVTSTSPAPAGATDKKPPLSATQLKLMKKILRRGPSDPRFGTAARLLDRQVTAGR